MSTWLVDATLIKPLPSPRAASFQKWCEATDASLFLSAASLAEIAGSIEKMPPSQSPRANALRHWLDEIAERFADRIYAVDAAISKRAGALLPQLTRDVTRHDLHDAILVATAQVHRHGLLTRREGIFGSWTQTPIVVV